jgi:hypothetical protein
MQKADASLTLVGSPDPRTPAGVPFSTIVWPAGLPKQPGLVGGWSLQNTGLPDVRLAGLLIEPVNSSDRSTSTVPLDWPGSGERSRVSPCGLVLVHGWPTRAPPSQASVERPAGGGAQRVHHAVAQHRQGRVADGQRRTESTAGVRAVRICGVDRWDDRIRADGTDALGA